MGQLPIRRHRVLLEDARRNGGYLRATWHPERRVFVVSTWDGEVCRGAVRLPAAEAADLIGLLADGLGDMARDPTRPGRTGRRGHLRTRLTAWLRGHAERGPSVLPMRNVSRTSERRRRSA